MHKIGRLPVSDASTSASGPPDPLKDDDRLFRRLSVVRAVDLLAETRPAAVIEGVAWPSRLTVLVAESGAGKTFLLLDAAAAVSDGVPWHGRSTQQGSAVYISYEGDELGLRIQAMSAADRRLEHLHVVRPRDPLSPRVTRDGESPSYGENALYDAITTLSDELRRDNQPPIRLIVIDTVRASMTGSEDSSEHVSAYLRAVRRLMTAAPAAATVLVHHAGWQDGGDTQRKRERGSSAWRGNCDATLYLDTPKYDAASGEAPLILRALKVRDGDKPEPLHLVRRCIQLSDSYADGRPVTSCIIQRDRRSPSDRAQERAEANRAAEREVDFAVLRAMRDCPTATSITKLRAAVGLRTEVVSGAVARILRDGLAEQGGRRQSFFITEPGHERLRTQR